MAVHLRILGCYSAAPRSDTHPTSQLLDIQNRHFLIDCGEATQVQLRRYKVKFSNIKHIFISHLHGDHYFGLPGLISTFRLLGRKTRLDIYGPEGLREIVTLHFRLSKSWIDFPLFFHELTAKEPELIYEDAKVEVHTIPLNHKIYTNGFLFKEKTGERKLNVEAAIHYGAEICDYHQLKKGKDFKTKDGEVIPNARLTFDPPEALSYAYCSDTAFYPEVVPQIKGVSLLYHEATFLESEKKTAALTKHSTAKQAATIAREADAGQLVLGHFSTRYKDITLFKKEAEEIFKDVILAEEGVVLSSTNTHG